MIHPTFDYSHEGKMLKNDAMFSVSDFIRDLGNFITLHSFILRLKMYVAEMEKKHSISHRKVNTLKGYRFWKYKHEENFREYIKEHDKNLTQQREIFADMLAEVEKLELKPREDITWFAVEPADYDEEIQNTLIDSIRIFICALNGIRKNNQIVFATDVHSVFDIAWYTLARMITDFGLLTDGGRTKGLIRRHSRDLSTLWGSLYS